jgi:hypothetical protein
LTVSIIHNHPTRSWLKHGSTTEILVNNTAPLKSLASVDRFLWLDDQERKQLQQDYSMVSLELIAEIHTERPGYVQVIQSLPLWQRMEHTTTTKTMTRWKQDLQRQSLFDQHALIETTETSAAETLWITGFSLAGRKGLLKSVDCASGNMGSINPRTERILQWPNEVVTVPEQLVVEHVTNSVLKDTTSASYTNSKKYALFQDQDALLVCDGFLVPGKDRGGLRVIRYPGDEQREWVVSLTPTISHRWFYHRAVWVDLTGDGRKSILAARCQVSVASRENGGVTSGISKTGQLVWLECPKPHSFDPETGTPLERDGTMFDPFSSRHVPWTAQVLADGPDVMFSVGDLDPTDDTIEVFSSQFFGRQVKLHSIQRGQRPAISFERILDDKCGAAFGSILADLDGSSRKASTTVARVIDSGCTVGTVVAGDAFSHLLVSSHECTYADRERSGFIQPAINEDGGSLYAYRVPDRKGAWKTEPWLRTTIASGFKVKGQLSNVINPGAPGFVYTFHAKKEDHNTGKRPLIAVAGDCAESAYIFRPDKLIHRNHHGKVTDNDDDVDPSTQYQLMVEIECDSTVGSIGIGYDDFTADMEQEMGHAKLYVPCHEKDKILVFALGSGEDEVDDGW